MGASEDIAKYADILATVEQATNKLDALRTARQEYDVACGKVRDAVDSYNQARLALFARRMAERGEDWCTYGEHPVKLPLTEMVVNVRGRGAYDRETDDLVLHHACTKCVQETQQRSTKWGAFTFVGTGENVKLPPYRDYPSVQRTEVDYEPTIGGWDSKCRQGYVEEERVKEIEQSYGLPPLAKWSYHHMEPPTLTIGERSFKLPER